MVTFRLGETVARLRRVSQLDPYSGEMVPGEWASADSVEIRNVAIAPSTSFSAFDPARSQIVSEMSLYADINADIHPHDRVVASSGLWQVESDQQKWTNPYNGRRAGLEIRVTKVVG